MEPADSLLISIDPGSVSVVSIRNVGVSRLVEEGVDIAFDGV